MGASPWQTVSSVQISALRLLSSRLAPVTRRCPGAAIEPQAGEGTMSSTLSQARFSAGQWIAEPSADAPLQPTDLDLIASTRPSIGRRASRAIVRFLITLCIDVTPDLALQSD